MEKWLLVLAAKRIPHLFLSRARARAWKPDRKRPGLYVPPHYAQEAEEEIRGFENERPFLPRTTQGGESGATYGAAGALLFLLLLFVWHGLRFHWFAPALPDPPFPFDPQSWPALFALNRSTPPGWEDLRRCLTALTLHADAQHLLSNMGFGLFFLLPLFRRAGQGFGLCLTIAGGMLGNLTNVLVCSLPLWPGLTPPPGGGLSLGFSTALFSALGTLCLFNASDALRGFDGSGSRELARKSVAPVAAGLALLGFLGGGGEARTDYVSHVSGFVCGLLLGLPCLLPDRRIARLSENTRALVQALLFSAALVFVAAMWLCSVRAFVPAGRP
ncbi:MAG: rhomboid family intramembrane serine protease [Desulfovibrio sp.]|jgi:membrane associated rhomboid family serine protease|nr:rhomboid family intramembrane serine protease [Desulfovibrio sp.]